jgi:hypothetical protein
MSLAAGALLLTGCGSSNPTTPTVPTPPPIVKSLVKQGSVPGQPESTVAAINFTTTKAGTLTATVDWTFATNQMEMALAKGTNTCFSNNNFDFNLCTNDVVSATSADGSKPKLLTVGSLPAGTYTLYVANLGPNAESWSFQIFLEG